MATRSAAMPPSREDIDEAKDRLVESQLSLAAIRDELEAAQRQLSQIQARAETTQAEIKRFARRVLQGEKALIRLARSVYMGGSVELLGAVLSASSMGELDSRIAYLRSSGDAHAEQLEAFAVDKKMLAVRLEDLETARADAAAILQRVRSLAAQIESQVAADRAEFAGLSSARERALQAAREAEEQALVVTTPPEPPASPESVNWDAIAQCESGGNWQLDGEYDGGLQFHPQTWLGYGGAEYAQYAWQATREQQIAIAEKVLAAQGGSAWPNCFQYG